jgi:hypothetical protein
MPGCCSACPRRCRACVSSPPTYHPSFPSRASPGPSSRRWAFPWSASPSAWSAGRASASARVMPRMPGPASSRCSRRWRSPARRRRRCATPSPTPTSTRTWPRACRSPWSTCTTRSRTFRRWRPHHPERGRRTSATSAGSMAPRARTSSSISSPACPGISTADASWRAPTTSGPHRRAGPTGCWPRQATPAYRWSISGVRATPRSGTSSIAAGRFWSFPPGRTRSTTSRSRAS